MTGNFQIQIIFDLQGVLKKTLPFELMIHKNKGLVHIGN